MTSAEGRKFGLTVGIAFLVFCGIAWWRGHDTMASVLGSLGGLLSLAALVVPSHLGTVQRAWMGLAHAISKVTTPVFMGIVYFVVIAPIGLLMRLLGKNPIQAKATDDSFWVPREKHEHSDLTRQF